MDKRRKDKILLAVLIVILIVVNYPLIDKVLENNLRGQESGVVERVIDGDTVVIGNISVRLLGINSPERGEPYYKEAKEFLELLILNKTVKMEPGREDLDRYSRKLRYLLIGTTNINSELIKEGLANSYFPRGKDKHYEEFKEIWKSCIRKKENLCEPSKSICSRCISLKKLDHKSQEVVLKNQCIYNCNLKNWSIKDEGRKKYEFAEVNLAGDKEITIKVGEGNDSKDILFWERKDYVWTATGDTLFLRDSEGKLVLWESY